MDLIYRFGIPLTKSYVTSERGAKQYILEGIASDETPDLQGESVIQKGMNFRPLLDAGIINWDHEKGPENIIGEPIEAAIHAGPVFYVKGELYVDDKPRAAEAWATAEAMKKSGRRKLAWSVEGAVLQRQGRHLTKTEVRHLALTHQPVNANSWAAIAKSMTAAGNQALMLENLDQQVTSVLWGDCAPDRRCYTNASGYFYGGRGGMLEHLVKCRGMKVDSAASLIKRLVDSGI